jgi:pyrroloquinoline quinone biosynthesis protein B
MEIQKLPAIIRHNLLSFFLVLTFSQCKTAFQKVTFEKVEPYAVVLGIAQDAGYPQAACRRNCCREAWLHPDIRKMVTCIGISDPESGKAWLIDATPDFRYQWQKLSSSVRSFEQKLAGVFLTHAHIGHYTGLMHLGREVMGADSVPVYCMPRMHNFLKENGPWSQLVDLGNIKLMSMTEDSAINIGRNIKLIPFLVPHRNEFSETVGFFIQSSKKVILYIPDIDKWHLWSKDLKRIIELVDFAFIDGTFYKNGEIQNRDMSEIPHPFIEESLVHLNELSWENRRKVHFIHFNHTNPVLLKTSKAREAVIEAGFNIAAEGMIIKL